VAAGKKNEVSQLAKAISFNRAEAEKQGGFAYVRRLSEHERKGGFIFIAKESLERFPPIGKEFIVRAGRKKAKAKIEAYACSCTGPGLLHRHYKVTGLKGLAGSKAVRLRDTSSGFVLERA